MTRNIRIAIAKTEAERMALYRLRYECYIEELGWDCPYADHKHRLLTDPLDDSGNLFGAFENGVAVATIRTNYGRDSDLGSYPRFFELAEDELDAISVTSRLVVRADHRRSRLFLDVMQECFERSVADGVYTTYVDCEFAKLKFYLALGFSVHRERVDSDFGVPGPCLRMHASEFRYRRPVLASVA
jgi:predicted GNAT family N-acyltransferase